MTIIERILYSEVGRQDKRNLKQLKPTLWKTPLLGRRLHYTTDKIPDNKEKKYSWQKKHLENQTGTSNSYKPTKIKKNDGKKKYETWK